MPRHAIIKSDIYEDLFDEGLSVDAIYVYLWYIITSKNLLGLYRTRYGIDRVSMGYPPKKFKKAKEELEKFGKILWENGWVWIVGKAKTISGPKQITSAHKLLKEIPDTVKLKQKLLERYDTLSMGYPHLDSFATPRPRPRPKELRDTKVSLVDSKKTESTGETKSSSPKKKSDPRITQLLKFWGWEFDEHLGTTYTASFGRDGKLLKDLLESVENNHRVPEDCTVEFIGGCMSWYLEEQKEREEKYLKPEIPGFYKNFNRICVEIFREEINWKELKEDYGTFIQKKGKIGKV